MSTPISALPPRQLDIARRWLAVGHSGQQEGHPMVVTRSEGNRVYEPDNRPALDSYLELISAPPAARTDPSHFTRFALTHPVGLGRRGFHNQTLAVLAVG